MYIGDIAYETSNVLQFASIEGIHVTGVLKYQNVLTTPPFNDHCSNDDYYKCYREEKYIYVYTYIYVYKLHQEYLVLAQDSRLD